MPVKGKATKTEIFLLLLTAAFVLLVCCVYFMHRENGAAPGYTVTVQKGNDAEAVTVKKININTADMEELQTLEGIGPVLAQRIVDWRNAGGVFETAEDLLEIQGIGEATLRQLREFIITEDES